MASWDERGWTRPRLTLVSGSGLAPSFEWPRRGPLPLQEFLPPRLSEISGIEGHPLEVELVEPPEAPPFVSFRGRLHGYQGLSAPETVFPIRLAALLGARVLIGTNASGGIDPALSPGDLVLVRDHLNLTGENPMHGSPPPEWGPRFPDMSEIYDADLRSLVTRHAERLGFEVHEGIYAGVSGPSYETPAEIRMLRTLGGDLVGMSTVWEMLAAHHMGLRCACLATVSNLAAGVGTESPEPLDHDQVLERASTTKRRLERLLATLAADPATSAQE